MTQIYDIFAVAPPGLEHFLLQEVRENGFKSVTASPGGISFKGSWPEVWRANLELRGASRVLVRIGHFMAFHLAQLDKRATKFPWSDTLPSGCALKVEVTSQKSKIYHAGAARERIETALTANGYRISADALVSIKARIDDNKVTLSLDSSGEGLHKRGHKQAIGKAPMRETLAALFLRQAGYSGAEPVLDPMCGSGTFPIEAAEIALGAQPGRARDFAFQHFVGFDTDAFAALRRPLKEAKSAFAFHGSDRDAGVISQAQANAARASVAPICSFAAKPVLDLTGPEGPPGLVMVNPPYGTRIGNKKLLYALHNTLGQVLQDRFKGWRVAIVTSETALAKASGLPFKKPSSPVPHGGLKVRLFQTDPL
ncbi:MAG: class I SAM-dependent RNA methyltransferase [Litoreibacter sp.]|nr:class I SAM-dependent RNA methyltransferase [Litoreibacter sp.]